jgi:NADH-quinone oxidoreductase subunit L
MVDYAYLIPLLPFAAAILIFFFGRWLPMKGAALGILACLASFGISFDLLMQMMDGTLKLPHEIHYPWFDVGLFQFEWGVLLDGPSLVLIVAVSGISALIQIYSVGYMHDAPRFKRFFSYLSLFTAAMLTLVLANNYLQFFIGWEIMGACSYFLISFEFERDAAGAAGNKAFLTTRLGDLGFYAGLLTIFFVLGTFNFMQIQNHLHDGNVSTHMALIIALLLFCGTIGKSAQVPLHVWLPDAMEGPTPVSALIHAATMVAAGVYLVARSYGFFLQAPQALEVVAWVGGITAIFAATIAVAADDIKKVLAYSTISQLGYMIMGLGVGGYSAGLFHLTTHAAFKALLFLGAGSIIHAVHTNDIWKMGSLSKQLPTTFWTFLSGTLALVAFWGTSGYFSKEMILGAAYSSHHLLLYSIGCAGAFLTSFYMTRAFSLVFLGEPRERDRFAHAQESSWSMLIPLMILAIPALGLGWVMHNPETLNRFFPMGNLPDVAEPQWVGLVASASGFLGLVVGGSLYLGSLTLVGQLSAAFAPIRKLLKNKYYIDELYWAVFVRPTGTLAQALAWFDFNVIDRVFVDGFGWAANLWSKIQSWIDDHIVDGAVNGGGWSAETLGDLARRVQNGYVQNYLLVIAMTLVALLMAMETFVSKH